MADEGATWVGDTGLVFSSYMSWAWLGLDIGWLRISLGQLMRVRVLYIKKIYLGCFPDVWWWR